MTTKKSILITGPQATGKTTKAKELVKDFKADEQVWLYDVYLPHHAPRCFDTCTPQTKVIVVEGVKSFYELSFWFAAIRDGIFLGLGDGQECRIHPQFIFTSQQIADAVTAKSHWFWEMFELIDLSKKQLF